MEKQYDKSKRVNKYVRKTKKFSFTLKRASDGYIYERFLKLREENLPITPYIKIAIRKQLERKENVDISRYIKPIDEKDIDTNIMHVTITFNRQEMEIADYIEKLDRKSDFITRAILEMIATGDLTQKEINSLDEKIKKKYNQRPQLTLFNENKKDEQVKKILENLYSKKIDDNEFMKDAIIEKWNREYKK